MLITNLNNTHTYIFGNWKKTVRCQNFCKFARPSTSYQRLTWVAPRKVKSDLMSHAMEYMLSKTCLCLEAFIFANCNHEFQAKSTILHQIIYVCCWLQLLAPLLELILFQNVQGSVDSSIIRVERWSVLEACWFNETWFEAIYYDIKLRDVMLCFMIWRDEKTRYNWWDA